MKWFYDKSLSYHRPRKIIKITDKNLYLEEEILQGKIQTVCTKLNMGEDKNRWGTLVHVY